MQNFPPFIGLVFNIIVSGSTIDHFLASILVTSFCWWLLEEFIYKLTDWIVYVLYGSIYNRYDKSTFSKAFSLPFLHTSV